jgi:DNA-directed RNA polymerase subunit beta
MEGRVARDSRSIIVAENSGVIEYVDSTKITVRYDINPNSIEAITSFNDVRRVTYSLIKFHGTNQETCINQKPYVVEGQKIEEGMFLLMDRQLKW